MHGRILGQLKCSCQLFNKNIEVYNFVRCQFDQCTLKVCLHVTDFSPFYGKRAVLGCSHLQYFVPFFSPCFLCLHVLNKAPFTPRGIVFIDLVFAGVFLV